MEKIINQFDKLEKLKIFEIPVINKITCEQEHIMFSISIHDSNLIAQHQALTIQELESKKIATKAILIDPDFSLDENLESLYEECLNAILLSDFFELAE